MKEQRDIGALSCPFWVKAHHKGNPYPYFERDVLVLPAFIYSYVSFAQLDVSEIHPCFACNSYLFILMAVKYAIAWIPDFYLFYCWSAFM